MVEGYCFLLNIIDENIETLPLLPRSISIQKTNGFARCRREVAINLQKTLAKVRAGKLGLLLLWLPLKRFALFWASFLSS